MVPDEFRHGMRISDAPESPGDFYTIPHECISCGAPAAAAPDLMAHQREGGHCYFIKQPSNQFELDQAIAAAHASCVGNVYYRGTDPKIISAIASFSYHSTGGPRQWSPGFFKRLFRRSR